MKLSGEFDLGDYHFACYMPSSNQEVCEWTIRVTKENELIIEETIPMVYEPIFGPDEEDVIARDTRVEEIIKELGLE
jgi:allophanate hydrolase subunit 1